MPYDPRPVSQGGNRGIDDTFSRVPSNGNYRVIGVDTFDGSDWVYEDYKTFNEAKKRADEEAEGKQTLKVYVYDSGGAMVHNAGEF